MQSKGTRAPEHVLLMLGALVLARAHVSYLLLSLIALVQALADNFQMKTTIYHETNLLNTIAKELNQEVKHEPKAITKFIDVKLIDTIFKPTNVEDYIAKPNTFNDSYKDFNVSGLRLPLDDSETANANIKLFRNTKINDRIEDGILKADASVVAVYKTEINPSENTRNVDNRLHLINFLSIYYYFR